MNDLKAAVRAHAEAAANDTRKALSDLVARRIKTASIGAMARFEEFVGRDLWGHGLPAEELSEAQAAWKMVWDKCRAEVLTHLNNQVRAAEVDLLSYEVRRAGRSVILPVVPPPGGRNV